jgi:hypothetical protein
MPDDEEDLSLLEINLTDQPPKHSNKGKGGRPRELLTYKLASLCWDADTGAPFWHCAAAACGKLHRGKPQKIRVLTHVVHCHLVSKENCDLAVAEQAKAAPGAKLAKTAKEVPGNVSGMQKPEAKQLSGTTATPVNPFAGFVAKGKQTLSDLLNHDLVLLVCKEGMVPRTLGSDTWK